MATYQEFHHRSIAAANASATCLLKTRCHPDARVRGRRSVHEGPDVARDIAKLMPIDNRARTAEMRRSSPHRINRT
jgi:hypothetical protein